MKRFPEIQKFDPSFALCPAMFVRSYRSVASRIEDTGRHIDGGTIAFLIA